MLFYVAVWDVVFTESALAHGQLAVSLVSAGAGSGGWLMQGTQAPAFSEKKIYLNILNINELANGKLLWNKYSLHIQCTCSRASIHYNLNLKKKT